MALVVPAAGIPGWGSGLLMACDHDIEQSRSQGYSPVQIKSEGRLISGAPNLDRQDGSRSFFLEERINSFKQEGLETGGCLRELGVQSDRGVEINVLIHQSVVSVKSYRDAGHLEREIAEGHQSVIQREITREVRSHAIGLRLFGIPTAAVAELVDFFLDVELREVR